MATVKNTKSGTKASAKPEVKKITKQDFLSAVSQMSDEEKKTFNAMMAVVPDAATENTGASTRRKVAPPKPERPPFVTEFAAAPVPEPFAAAAVFRSKHLGFWQLLKNSYKERFTDDDFQIHAPVFAEFTDGEWSAETEEDANLMRAKIAKKRRKGGGLEVSEVPVAVAAEVGVNLKPVKSKDVTVDTPIGEVITPGVL